MTLHQKPGSDEAFAVRLSQPVPGDEGAAAPDHADLRNLQMALKSYRGETLQWAERRSAGQPSLAALANKQQRWIALPRWSMAMVAAVTIAGGVAHLASTRAAIEQSPATLDISSSATGQPSTPADIAADNQLLSSINAELSYHARSPVDSLNLRSGQANAVPGVND